MGVTDPPLLAYREDGRPVVGKAKCLNYKLLAVSISLTFFPRLEPPVRMHAREEFVDSSPFRFNGKKRGLINKI